VSDWQPISTALKDKKRKLLGTNYPKARYPVITGAWNERLGEWRSEPGGWPMRPTHWKPLDDPPA